MQVEWRLLIGLAASALIGAFALWRGSLTPSGAWGAVIVGTTLFGFGGWAAGLTLIAFFASSSLLSHFKENNARKQRAAEMFEKGGQRDIWQALANGGAAAIFAVVYGLIPLFDPQYLMVDAPLLGYLLVSSQAAMLGALATVNADTWATELGVLNKSNPRLITTFKTVAPGTSGAITLFGCLAACAGAMFVSLLYVELLNIEFFPLQQAMSINTSFVLLWETLSSSVEGLLIFTMAGLLGSLFDSFLGATVQAMYYCDARQKETEKAIERDGTPNRHLRGWKWMNNDWVNFISSLFGALVAVMLSTVIF